jgi:adenine-specific DNA-methyltransferase
MVHCVRPEGTPGAGDPWDLELDELVVVRRFGEPIFPVLVPMDQVQNGSADAPWHCLIETDTPRPATVGHLRRQGDQFTSTRPTTPARGKYNNDYVDANDAWRTEVVVMEKRLGGQRLLNPEKGC